MLFLLLGSAVAESNPEASAESMADAIADADADADLGYHGGHRPYPGDISF